MAAMCGLQDYQKSHICVVFKLIIPWVFLCIFFGLLDQFGWQYPFLVAHLGFWTLICTVRTLTALPDYLLIKLAFYDAQ